MVVLVAASYLDVGSISVGQRYLTNSHRIMLSRIFEFIVVFTESPAPAFHGSNLAMESQYLRSAKFGYY